MICSSIKSHELKKKLKKMTMAPHHLQIILLSRRRRPPFLSRSPYIYIYVVVGLKICVCIGSPPSCTSQVNPPIHIDELVAENCTDYLSWDLVW